MHDPAAARPGPGSRAGRLWCATPHGTCVVVLQASSLPLCATMLADSGSLVTCQDICAAGDSEDAAQGLRQLAAALLRVDTFYNSLGGLAGYQRRCLELCATAAAEDGACAGSDGGSDGRGAPNDVVLHMPVGVDLANDRAAARRAAADGLHALPYMAEVYPLGGAGDRLGLTCDASGDCLPTAMLPYCGRTLLEGLVRDLQARRRRSQCSRAAIGHVTVWRSSADVLSEEGGLCLCWALSA